MGIKPVPMEPMDPAPEIIKCMNCSGAAVKFMTFGRLPAQPIYRYRCPECGQIEDRRRGNTSIVVEIGADLAGREYQSRQKPSLANPNNPPGYDWVAETMNARKPQPMTEDGKQGWACGNCKRQMQMSPIVMDYNPSIYTFFCQCGQIVERCGLSMRVVRSMNGLDAGKFFEKFEPEKPQPPIFPRGHRRIEPE